MMNKNLGFADLIAPHMKLHRMKVFLGKKSPTCPHCDEVNTRINDVKRQKWYCKSCKRAFFTEYDIS